VKAKLKTFNSTKISFLTADSPRKIELGNQRSRFFLDIFTSILDSQYGVEILRLNPTEDYREFSNLGKSIAFAEDIEFSKNIEVAILERHREVLDLAEHLSHSVLLIVDNCYVAPLAIEAKKMNPALKMIYISHNIEFEIKRQIGILQNWPNSILDEYISWTNNIENRIIRSSDFVFCCSDSDMLQLLQRGSNRCLVVPNGAHSWKNRKYSASDIYTTLACNKFALFVASGHPPNFQGFLHGIGLDLGFLREGEKIVIAGNAGTHISQVISRTKYHKTFLEKALCLEFVGTHFLAALYEYASVTLLPIFQGGGTNIKTAEAFLNSKFVISSQFALRGFDGQLFKHAPCQIVSTQKEFKTSILSSMEIEYPENSANGDSEYSWDWIAKTNFDDILKCLVEIGVRR